MRVDNGTGLKHQSPIDIATEGWRKKQETYLVAGDADFSYRYGALSYSDAVPFGSNGAIFKFRDDQKGSFITSAPHIFKHDVPYLEFEPIQFHFHSGVMHSNPANMGSEHTYNGKHFDLELHIVHFNKNKTKESQDFLLAAVIGVMFKASDTTELTYADKFLRKLFSGEPVDTERDFIDHLNLIHRFVYRGSLTTPKYSETLLWNMCARIAHINFETLKLFRHNVALLGGKGQKIFGMPNRDVQDKNGRKVFEIIEGKQPHDDEQSK